MRASTNAVELLEELLKGGTSGTIDTYAARQLTRFEEVQVDDLPDKIRSSRRSAAMSGTELTELLTLEEVERRHVLRVLQACDRNRTDAAKMLGLDRKALYRKLLRWGVTDE